MEKKHHFAGLILILQLVFLFLSMMSLNLIFDRDQGSMDVSIAFATTVGSFDEIFN
jgi:hypothetical protein